MSIAFVLNEHNNTVRWVQCRRTEQKQSSSRQTFSAHQFLALQTLYKMHGQSLPQQHSKMVQKACQE